MNLLSKEFIRDVKRVIGVEYITSLLGAIFAPLVHDHDDRYFTETESDARFAPIVHNHDDRYFTETESDARFAPIVHTHDDRYYTETETDTLLAGKAALVHIHDDRYYTESETDTLLAAKLNSSSYTAADVLTKIKTVDGTGSGLDADTIDGVESNVLARTNASNTFVGRQTVQGASDNAQIKLERTTSSTGSGYIGANSTYALNVLDSGLTTRFGITQAGYLYLPYLPLFQTSYANARSTTGYVQWAAPDINQASGFSSGTGLFTAPVAGVYEFSTAVFIDMQNSTSTYGYIGFMKNGVAYGGISHSPYGVSMEYITLNRTILVSLAAGDTIGVYFTNGSSGSTVIDNSFSMFSGKLIG